MAIDSTGVKIPRRMDDEERSVLAIKICNKDRELRRLKARVKEENDRLDTLRGQWDSGIIEEDAQQELPLDDGGSPDETRQMEQGQENIPAFTNGAQDRQPAQPPPAEPPQQDDTAEMEQAFEDGLVDAPRPVDGEPGVGREPGTRDDGSRPF